MVQTPEEYQRMNYRCYTGEKESTAWRTTVINTYSRPEGEGSRKQGEGGNLAFLAAIDGISPIPSYLKSCEREGVTEKKRLKKS